MFGKRLKELREERNLTQAELGKLLGKSHNNISQFERGIRTPNMLTLIDIAAFFGVSTDYLLGITDFRKGRIVSKEELRDFLPEKLISEEKFRIFIDENMISEEIKQEIINTLKKKGYRIE